MQRVITELNHWEEEKEEKKSAQDLHQEIVGNTINEQVNCNRFWENDLKNTSNSEISTNNHSSLPDQSKHKHGFLNIEASRLTSFDKVEVFSKEESKRETNKENESKLCKDSISTKNEDNLSQQQNMGIPIESNFKTDGIQQKLLNSQLILKNTYHSSKKIKKLSRAESFGIRKEEQANRDHYYDDCEVSPRFQMNNIKGEFKIDKDSKKENKGYDNK